MRKCIVFVLVCSWAVCAGISAGEFKRIVDIDVVVSPSGEAGTATLTVTDEDGAPATGYYKLTIWFVDSNSALAEVTSVPPAVPGVATMEVVTDASGVYVLDLEETGPLSRWFIVVSVQDQCYVSSQIVIGV